MLLQPATSHNMTTKFSKTFPELVDCWRSEIKSKLKFGIKISMLFIRQSHKI